MNKLVFIFCLLAYSANAQQITLQNAINIALQKSLDIQIAKNNVQASKLNNNIAIAGGVPTITATANNQENLVNINQTLNTGVDINRNGAATNTLSANVNGSMVLYNGYKVIATKKRLEELEKMSEQQLNIQIQNTIALVMQRYFDVVRQQHFIKAIEQSLTLSKKQLEIIKTKQQVGLANNANVYQSQIDVNSRLQDLQSQQLLLKQSFTDFLNALNLNTDTVLFINDSIVVDKNMALTDIVNFIPLNPQATSLQQQININEFIEKEIATQRTPTLRANTGINYGRTQSNGGQLLLNQSYGPFVGLSFSVPIYNGGIVKRQQQVAAINTQNAKLAKQNFVTNLQAAAIKTFQAYNTCLQQIKTQQNTFELSLELVNLRMQSLQLNNATILEVREAQKSFEDASYRLINLSYLAKFAEIELKKFAGKLAL